MSRPANNQTVFPTSRGTAGHRSPSATLQIYAVHLHLGDNPTHVPILPAPAAPAPDFPAQRGFCGPLKIQKRAHLLA